MGNTNKSENSLNRGLAVWAAIILLILAVSLSGCAPTSSKKNSATLPKTNQEKQPSATDRAKGTGSVKSVTVTTKTTKSDEPAIKVQIKIPQISGMKDAQKQKYVNQALAKPSMHLKDLITKDAREYYNETQKTGEHFWQYEVAADYVVHYNQNGLLSVTVDNYQFTGGAHGGTERLPFNVDLNSGKFLALKDLFKPGYDYKTVIDNEVRQQIAKQEDMYFKGQEGFQGIGGDRSYYLIPGYVVVYFAQYEIAPYAAGMPEFKIPVGLFGNNIDQRLASSPVKKP